MARILLAQGADVHAKNSQGLTPLHRAAAYGRKNVAELLIANGAQLNAKDDQGRTPLSLAEEQGHEEIIELLCRQKGQE